MSHRDENTKTMDASPNIPGNSDEKERRDDDYDWDLDPDNARNWTAKRKWTAVFVVSLYTLIPPLGSSMMAPGLPDIANKYAITSQTTLALTLSVFLLSFAIGPLFLAPLSEMYGRTWVFHIANVFSIAFSLGCAFSPSAGVLIAFRFLSGFSGAAPIACGGGTVGDLFSERDRASAMALYTIGPLLGPAVGPIAGGYIAQSAGVKWVFITIAAACGLASLVGLPLLRETYAPIIRMRKAKKQPAKQDVESLKASVTPLGTISRWQYLWINLSRPVMLLCRSFICFILSLYMAFLYGIYYLMFATFASLFSETYGFDTGAGGLTYLGLGIGFIIATFASARFTDQIYHYLAQKNNGKGTPEMRIPALFFGSLFVPVGLFWYGWSAATKAHWIMPIIGSGIFAFGMNCAYLPIQLYLVDAFTYAASALAAASVFRSILGFAFPLFGAQMFEAMGIGGGNSFLGGLAIVLGIPFPVWIYYKGAEMRARSDLNR
ncbi:mfs multidrug [Moniliophthora roreri MCA 2997]|uniref:Mfs multidrug n=1 Tax=Moniliophthora roreri (strain MCA 2997) TaxID=1381753 RepID=V2YER0_MONRO|nr:mfs multidrug [Moniliophthora roreri MCA 2997]